MVSRYPKVLITVDIADIKQIANGSATYAETFQGNVNQVNGGCQAAYSEPHQTSNRDRSSELFTPKGVIYFRKRLHPRCSARF